MKMVEVTLIPGAEKSPNEVSSYRPISLLPIISNNSIRINFSIKCHTLQYLTLFYPARGHQNQKGNDV